MVIVVTRACGSVLLLFFAPWAQRLRLIPVSTSFAIVFWRVCVFAVGIALICVASVEVFDELTEQGDQQSPEALAIAVLSALVVLVVSITGIVIVFKAVQQHEKALRPRAMRTWRAYLISILVVLFALWLIDLQQLLWTVALLGFLFPTLALISAWVTSGFATAAAEFHAKRLREREKQAQIARAEAEAAGEEFLEDEFGDDDEDVIDPYESYRPLAVRLARFSVIIIVGFSLAAVWNIGILERNANPSVAQRVFEILLDSAFALLIADLLWTWGKSVIDRRMANYRPPEDGQAPGPEARMATLLPLLRVVLQATLLSIVVMTLLTAAGVNIAPIIAGAGVIGIAIGFGAQSLVKDVVSGIFFLIDDAFRVGEYVEIDTLRGTVEKISIRSLQLRHHRGAVHTLPFGELKSLTNHSRDWVIMKLEFRVPFETDLKLVKKLVKQVGAELKANPDYGDSILQTLKSQGVRRMEEFNMVVGVKFMTRPGEQWLVRRDAYQGVRDIFEANGIRMAERNVKVEIAGDHELSEEDKQAVSAAAQQAVEQSGPPKPIPDEP
jgi:small-conductance mechanosensitive channel